MSWPADQTCSSRRGAKHDGSDALGLQAVEGGDDTVGHLGTEGVAPALVVESDDADLSEHFGPDNGAFEADGPGRGRAALGARLTIVLQSRALLPRVDRMLSG